MGDIAQEGPPAACPALMLRRVDCPLTVFGKHCWLEGRSRPGQVGVQRRGLCPCRGPCRPHVRRRWIPAHVRVSNSSCLISWNAQALTSQQMGLGAQIPTRCLPPGLFSSSAQQSLDKAVGSWLLDCSQWQRMFHDTVFTLTFSIISCFVYFKKKKKVHCDAVN